MLKQSSIQEIFVPYFYSLSSFSKWRKGQGLGEKNGKMRHARWVINEFYFVSDNFVEWLQFCVFYTLSKTKTKNSWIQKERKSKKLIRFSFISVIASIEISGCEDLLGATVFRKWNQVFLKFCSNILKN